MEDSLSDGEKANKSECDLDWLFGCYLLCYDKTHVYMSDDIFTFDDTKTLMVFYQELVKLLHQCLIRCNTTQIGSTLDNFDFSDNRCDRYRSFGRRDILKHEANGTTIDYYKERSYAWLVVNRCTTGEDIPSYYSNLFEEIKEMFYPRTINIITDLSIEDLIIVEEYLLKDME